MTIELRTTKTPPEDGEIIVIYNWNFKQVHTGIYSADNNCVEPEDFAGWVYPIGEFAFWHPISELRLPIPF